MKLNQLNCMYIVSMQCTNQQGIWLYWGIIHNSKFPFFLSDDNSDFVILFVTGP